MTMNEKREQIRRAWILYPAGNENRRARRIDRARRKRAARREAQESQGR